jgi:Calcium-binding EGF domain
MMAPGTTSSRPSQRMNDSNFAVKRCIFLAIAIVIVPFLLKYVVVQHDDDSPAGQGSIRPIISVSHLERNNSAVVTAIISQPQTFTCSISKQDHFFKKESPSRRNMHRELTFRRNNYCRRTFDVPGDTYQTVSVLRLFAFFSLLFNPNDVRGTCGQVCKQICNHKPCTADFVSPDDALCECFASGTYKCAANTFCGEKTDLCTCNAGYEGDPLTGCTDINECRNDVCGPNGACVNTPGSYRCDCKPGFNDTSPKGGCVDINECIVAPPCGPNSICTNTVGSFLCGCNAGFTGSPPTIFCTDIDECTTRAPCGPNAASCNNIAGSYTCTCKSGYRDTSPNGGCVNINECTEGGNNCNVITENCVDTVGSFNCNCKIGYSGTQGNCVDVNECATGSICGPNATCTNLIGNYTCACNAGFLGGRPPECRKLNSFEKCPGPTSDCAPGLTCAITSRSDSSTSCCATTYPCQVDRQCCSGAYTAGQACPSKLSLDCRSPLTCAWKSVIDNTYICCDNTIPNPLGSNRICV